MKRFFPAQRIVLAILCTLLAAGCANKPNPDALTAAPAAPVAVTPPAADPTPSPAPVVEPQPEVQKAPPVAKLERIHFAFDQYTLSDEARAVLAADAAALKDNALLKVSIEGHCDDRGSDEYNLALGERRARAARNYLVSLGVAPERLEVISYGEEQPLDPANTPEAWTQNRRAELKPLN